MLELQRWQWAVVITPTCESEGISLSHCVHKHPHVSHGSPLLPPSTPQLGLALDSEWVTPLFTIFQIPSQVFGLAGCSAFSLAITGLLGFSNGAFEEITLFSLSLKVVVLGGGEGSLASSSYSQSHRPSLSTVWRTWLLKYPRVSHEWRHRCTCTLYASQFGWFSTELQKCVDLMWKLRNAFNFVAKENKTTKNYQCAMQTFISSCTTSVRMKISKHNVTLTQCAFSFHNHCKLSIRYFPS